MELMIWQLFGKSGDNFKEIGMSTCSWDDAMAYKDILNAMRPEYTWVVEEITLDTTDIFELRVAKYHD